MTKGVPKTRWQSFTMEEIILIRKAVWKFEEVGEIRSAILSELANETEKRRMRSGSA